MSTGNRRVDALLDCAARYGLSVQTSEYVHDCWRILGDNGHSLTVFGGKNHSATVWGDLPGEQNWVLVSQRRARALMAQGSFNLEEKSHG